MSPPHTGRDLSPRGQTAFLPYPVTNENEQVNSQSDVRENLPAVSLLVQGRLTLPSLWLNYAVRREAGQSAWGQISGVLINVW